MECIREATNLREANQIADNLSQREVWKLLNIRPDSRGRMESVGHDELRLLVELRWILAIYEKDPTKENLHAFVLLYAINIGNSRVLRFFDQMIESHSLKNDIDSIKPHIRGLYLTPNDLMGLWRCASARAKEQISMYYEHTNNENMLYLIDME